MSYKLSNQAYTIERFDLTHDQIHTLEKAIDDNYKQGGGFGYICIPEVQNEQTTSHFPNKITNTVCKPVFFGKDLISKKDDGSAHNANVFNGEQYFILNSVKGATTVEADINQLKTGLGL